MLKFWETFEPNLYNAQFIKPHDLYHLTRLTSIARERARIQNTYKLFQASSKVRYHRGTLSEEEKEKRMKLARDKRNLGRKRDSEQQVNKVLNSELQTLESTAKGVTRALDFEQLPDNARAGLEGILQQIQNVSQ